MKVPIIKSVEEYENVCTRIEQIFDAKRGTPEFDELDVLCERVHQYDNKHYPLPYFSPVETLEYRMEILEMSRQQLADLIGFPLSQVSDVLNHKMPISPVMREALSQKLRIKPEALIEKKQYTIVTKKVGSSASAQAVAVTQ